MATAAKPGPKFKTPTDKAWALSTTARLDRLGCSQFQIAKELGVSQPAACGWLRRVRENYQEIAKVEYAAKVQETVALLRDIRWEAWQAWEKSKEDGEKEVKEKTPFVVESKDKKGATVKRTIERLKTILTREGRLPASEYLNVILKTVSMECELYGIDAEKAPVQLLMQINQGNAEAPFDWSPFTGKPEVVDPVEEALKQLPPPKEVEALVGESSNGVAHP